MKVVTENLILLLISSTKVVHFCKETKKICATEHIKLNSSASCLLRFLSTSIVLSENDDGSATSPAKKTCVLLSREITFD